MNLILPSDKTYSIEDCVATVGIFDGVHAGHRYLIEELKQLAREQKMKSVVITFAEQPRKVLNPSLKVDLLSTLDEKIKHLESSGVDTCIVLDFTPAIARLSASEFIHSILSEQYKVRTLLVGHDHRFGHNRADGFAEYKQYGAESGMEVIQASRYTTPSDPEISSSVIRQMLLQGDVESAARILSYPYAVKGTVVEGFKNGRTIGFPTANIQPYHSDKLIPKNGVYHVRVLVNNRHYTGMLNIGNRPTLNNGSHISIEVHLLDFNEDIYHQPIEVEFLHKIRDEKKFNGIAELIERLNADKEYVLKLNK